jgi:hypothetical protein
MPSEWSRSSHETSRASVLEAAFPASLRQAVAEVSRIMPPATFELAGAFAVTVEGESVEVPMRIYNPEPLPEEVEALTSIGRAVLWCIYTRHNDGFVRQRYLRRAIELDHVWVVPFVVQLIGEYVAEILVDIREGLVDLDVPGSEQPRRFGRFVAENPSFFDLTRQRIASYWNCYQSAYRRSEYPGLLLISSLESAAAEQSA